MSSPTPRGSEHFDPLAVTDDEDDFPMPAPKPATPPTPAARPAFAPTAAAAKVNPAPVRVSTRTPPAPQPAATPAQAQKDTPVKQTGDTTEQNTSVPAQATTDNRTPEWYARRRSRLKWVALIAILAIAWLAWNQPWKDVVSTANATGPVTLTADATDQISQDYSYAEQYLAVNGTFSGIALEGAQVAVRDQTLYAVRTVNGVCTVYGILNGQRLDPAPDATGAACAGQIVTVQAALDAAANQAQATSTDSATATLEQAAKAAVNYASRHFEGGVPSMTGLPTSLSGAVVIENTGEYVQLRVSYPSACLQAYVTAAGEIGDTTTCS